METNKRFAVSAAPHIFAKDTTAMLMMDVIAALMPTVAAGIWLFGWSAARVILICVTSCVGFEFLWQAIFRKTITINDLSAVVTGIILALNMPSTAPWWMIIIGSAVAIVLVKQLFGGIGDNFVNPAISARAVLVASWPALMSGAAFVTPFDAVSGATPIVLFRQAAEAMAGAPSVAAAVAVVPPSLLDLFIGRIPGCIGEVSKIAILLGLTYLLIRKTITWHIPMTMIASFMGFTMLFGGDPLQGVLMGSILFGAVFMATDYVTCPMTRIGQMIFAAGAGLLIALIRAYGGYPEGTTFAILIMNLLTPLIDRVTRGRIYGEVKARA
ncbi:MAG: RnfABCDGE type electron transport complex subunit D [Eubacteriales bacterium]|nr:RnfABCDGE type electron transport complex subunit D [Eubacteriales bacterium]